mgnify:CR=1 FL=1
MTIEDAVFYLKSLCTNMGAFPTDYSGYYCGVTNDLERRAGEHKAEFLGYVTAKTVKGAIDLEARMHQEGFYTGEQLGNAGDNSVFVYVYKMGPDTVE